MKPGVSEGVENGCSLKLLGEAKWGSFPRAFWQEGSTTLEKVQMPNSAIPILGIFFSPRSIIRQLRKEFCMRLFVPGIFIKQHDWKHPNLPL